jgi:hypothetical protein
VHPACARSTEGVGELIDRADHVRTRDGSKDLLVNRSKLLTHVLLERFRFKLGRFARSSKVTQDAIDLSRFEMSVSAVLDDLTGFIAKFEPDADKGRNRSRLPRDSVTKSGHDQSRARNRLVARDKYSRIFS